MTWPFGAKRRALEAQTAANNAIAEFMRQRSFEAAQFTRTIGEWKWDGGFSNTDVLGSLPVIRSRSRDMAKNSPLYARFIQLMRENVVGDGFRFKALPAKDAADPLSVDADAARRLEYHWWKWASNPGFADVAKRQNLVQLLALAVENWVRDGEAFLFVDTYAQNRYGVAVRIVRADCIDETMNATLDDGRVVRGGIEFDTATNRPTAYYFNGSRADSQGVVFNGREKMRVEAQYVIHLFERHDADQVRGVPLGYAALAPLKMLDEYTKAELVAARHEACTVGVFHSPQSQVAPQGGAPSSEQKAQAREMIAAGQEIWLPAGWDYDSHTPNHPNRGWTDYSQSLQRLVSIGLGVDFTELTGNATGGISVSVRQAILRTREMYRTRQGEVVSLVLDRLYHAWLRSFLSLSVSGELSLHDFDRLCDHEFQGRRWGWVDPAAEVNAATTAVAHGWRTDAEVAADYGNDIDDNIAEAARVRGPKEAAGLITIGNGQGSAPVKAEPDPKEEPDDEGAAPARKAAAKSKSRKAAGGRK